jgi:hypothetical protein
MVVAHAEPRRSRRGTRLKDPDDIAATIVDASLHVHLLNPGAQTLRETLRRIVNGLQPSASSRLRVNQRSTRGVNPSAGNKGIALRHHR